MSIKSKTLSQNKKSRAHACNSSYSGHRNQDDCGSKSAQAIVHETLSQNNSSQKRAGGVAQGVDPEFNPQYHKKKKVKLRITK
jgi:hypothetical protein